MVDFTPSDVKKTQLLDPGWYPFKIKYNGPGVSKSSGGATETFTFIGHSGEAKDLEIDKSFSMSEKARFMMLPLFKACGAKIDEKGAKGLDPKNLDGRVIDIFVKHREYEGRTFNEASDFRPAQGVTA